MQLRGQAAPALGAHHRLHRRRGLTKDLHFFFEVPDALPRRRQFRALLGRGARLQATVNLVAVPPPVQARLSDPQRRRNITDSAPGLD